MYDFLAMTKNMVNEDHIDCADCSLSIAIWFYENADDLMDNWYFIFHFWILCLHLQQQQRQQKWKTKTKTKKKRGHLSVGFVAPTYCVPMIAITLIIVQECTSHTCLVTDVLVTDDKVGYLCLEPRI